MNKIRGWDMSQNKDFLQMADTILPTTDKRRTNFQRLPTHLSDVIAFPRSLSHFHLGEPPVSWDILLNLLLFLCTS